MHGILFDHLIRSKDLFSLLVDETTDKSNTPHVIVLIQTIEDGHPFSYFYRIIELKYGESS
jgi:hypothetical protein